MVEKAVRTFLERFFRVVVHGLKHREISFPTMDWTRKARNTDVGRRKTKHGAGVAAANGGGSGGSGGKRSGKNSRCVPSSNPYCH